jgi:hypothetical protein
MLDLAFIAVHEEKTQRGEDVPERMGLNDVGEWLPEAADLAFVEP